MLTAIIVIGGAGYFIFGRKEKIEYVTAKVERGKITQTVSETGTVKASSKIDLNFLANGKIAEILVKEGDKVKEGGVLAKLDYGGLIIKEREAQANLDKLLGGAAPVDIAVAQAGVEQAKSAYASALDSLEKTKKTAEENIRQAQKTFNDLTAKTANDVTTYEQAVAVAQTSLENAKSTYQKSIDNSQASLLTAIESKLAVANTALDNINTIITDKDAESTLSVKNISYLSYTKDSRAEASILLVTANAGLASAKIDSAGAKLDKATGDALTVLNKTLSSLNYCYKALENSISSSAFAQTELDVYKTNINTQIININTAISAVETAKQNFDSAVLAYNTNVASSEKSLAQAQTNLDNAVITARNGLATAQTSGAEQIVKAQAGDSSAYEAWKVAEAQFNKIKAPARAEDIIAAQAALDAIKKQIEDSIIKAPADGTITKINYEIGEQPASGSAFISMLGDNHFGIEVLVSEADIAKVKKGDKAEITLDAFGPEEKFSGRISFIEPAETVVQDVIYYKTEVGFDAGDRGVKSGMTANVNVITAEKNNVLVMPARAIVEKEGGKYVRILSNKKISESAVEIGLRGDGGMVEVLSGVNEGDEAVTFIKN